MVVLVARPVKTIIVLMTIKVKSGRQKKAKGRQKGTFWLSTVARDHSPDREPVLGNADEIT